MHSRHYRPCIALGSGILTAVTGAVLVAAYVIEAVLDTAGEADRSLLFWYLPFLFLGLLLFAAGLVMGVWGLLRLLSMRRRLPVDAED